MLPNPPEPNSPPVLAPGAEAVDPKPPLEAAKPPEKDANPPEDAAKPPNAELLAAGVAKVLGTANAPPLLAAGCEEPNPRFLKKPACKG